MHKTKFIYQEKVAKKLDIYLVSKNDDNKFTNL